LKTLKIKSADEPIEIGSIVKYKDHSEKTRVGEITSIFGNNKQIKFEVILYDKRLQPIIRADGSYSRKNVLREKCKHVDEKFLKENIKGGYELGDVVCRVSATIKKFGVIVGYTHPDGLVSSSYENGYNGTDFIDCVEISKRGLEVKRNHQGTIKRFTSTSERLKCCEVDLWNHTGPKILLKE